MKTRAAAERGGTRWVRETRAFGLFLGCFVACVVLAIGLLAQHVGGLAPFVAAKGHVIAGVLAYLLFLVVVARHLVRMAGRVVGVLTMACLLSPVSIFWIEVPPSFALVLGVVPMGPLAFVYARIHRSGFKRYIALGVLVLAMAHVVFVSGIFLGVFPPEAMSGDWLGRARTLDLHAAVGLPMAVLLLGHALWTYYGRSFRTDASARGTVVPAAVVCTLLLVAGWGASRPLHEGAGDAIAGEAGLPGGSRQVDLAAVHAGVPESGVDPARLVDPVVCGNAACHPHLYRQWRLSSHRFAAVNRPYAKTVALLAEEEGPEATHFCARCHNPLVAAMGKTEYDPDPVVQAATEVGVTCQWCHITSGADVERGNGHLTVTFEPRARAEHSILHRHTTDDDVSSFTLDGLGPHADAYRHPVHFEPPGCGGCHRIVTPVELSGGEVSAVQEDLYTPWTHSSSAQQGIDCIACHLQLHVYEDPTHARPDHRSFGTIRTLSRLVPAGLVEPGEELAAFDADADRWTRGELPVSTYEQLYMASIGNPKTRAYREFLRGRRAMGLAIEAPASVAAGGELVLVVRTSNQTRAHPLPTGPLDMNELWLEVLVTDATGRRTFESGVLDARGRVPAEAHRLGGTLVDRAGRSIERHRIWKVAGVANERLLPADGAVEDRYVVPVPPDAVGPLSVAVGWRYRRITPDLSEWMLDGEVLPVHAIVDAAAAVAVVAPSPERQG